MVWLLLLPLSLFAQEADELKEIDFYKDVFPTHEIQKPGVEFKRDIDNKYNPPYESITEDMIMSSETEHGHLKANSPLINLKTNSVSRTTKEIYTQAHRLQDEFGYRYLINKSGEMVYKVHNNYFTSVRHELVLYEPPHQYTPAPKNKIVHRDFDSQFKYAPEVGISLGVVDGNYMTDLFNDEEASSGFSTQVTGAIFAEWKLPIKFGMVIGYERSNYKLSNGGKITYSSFNFGPQFRSKDFSLFENLWRVQAQFRFGPYANLDGQTANGDIKFKFRSSDFIFGIEKPITNDWGEFVVGLFMHNQWLNMKDQPEIVKVNSSSEINRSIGLSFSQVFK